jgi:hypothetical protein
VGDVPELSSGLNGHFLVDYTADSVADGIRKGHEFRKAEKFTKGPEVIRQFGMTPNLIASRIMRVYRDAVKGSSSN